MTKKIKLGQFFTAKNTWLMPHILDFIKNSKKSTIYDPFAGNGDLFKALEVHGFHKFVGLDIDPALQWKINDSLKSIPKIPEAIIVTNPPYLAKQSASRKKLDLKEYFNSSSYDDVYLIALEKMLISQEFVVAIIPESFINSSFLLKERLHSITILEENPFHDTENPVCVACFDKFPKSTQDIFIYKNHNLAGNLKDILDVRIFPSKQIKMKFNTLKGWLALRAVDSTDDSIKIHFALKNEIPYNWEKGIKVSSRHMTLIDLNIPDSKKKVLIKNANQTLNEIREKSQSILLTPFMGNTKLGVRRRRLDYDLARAIIEKAYMRTMKKLDEESILLFD